MTPKMKQVERIIAFLEHAREKPGMYFSESVIPSAIFLSGFTSACRLLFGDETDGDSYLDILEERGWSLANTPLWHEMGDKGFDDRSIHEELFTILIESWKRRKEKLKD